MSRLFVTLEDKLFSKFEAPSQIAVKMTTYSTPRAACGAPQQRPAVTLPAQPAASSALAGIEECPSHFPRGHNHVSLARSHPQQTGCERRRSRVRGSRWQLRRHQHSPLPRHQNDPPTCPQQRGGPPQQAQEPKDLISWGPDPQWDSHQG